MFSFIRLGDGNDWLFASAAKVLAVPKGRQADVEILTEYAPLFGRLIVNLYKGNKFSRYTFNLSKYLDDATVKEILPVMYSGNEFRGYDQCICRSRSSTGYLGARSCPRFTTRWRA